MRSPVGTEVSPPGLRGGWDAVWKQDRRTSHSPTRPEGALPTKRTGEKPHSFNTLSTRWTLATPGLALQVQELNQVQQDR